MSIEEHEKKAKDAEQRLAALEKVVFDIGKGDAQDALRLQMLMALREVRQVLGAAAFEQKRLQGERDAAVARANKLSVENEKLKYRNKHLIKTVREMEGQNPPKPPPQLKRWSTTPWDTKSPLDA